MSKAPHSFIFRLFRWYCDPAIVDDIEGDLLERYERHYKNRKFPNWLLARDVLLLFRPGIIRTSKKSRKLGPTGALWYFLRIALRNTKRADNFSWINVLGLSIALASVVLIYQYVHHEHQTDSCFNRSNEIYRLVRQVNDGDASYRTPTLAAPFRDRLLHEMGLSEHQLIRVYQDDELVTFQESSFFESQFFYVDPYFFQLLDYPFLHGNPRSALSNPDQVVISQRIALKYFGTEYAIGKILQIDNKAPLKVTGVLASANINSHLDIDFIAPLTAMGYTSRILASEESHAFSYYLQVEKGKVPKNLPGFDAHQTITWQPLSEVYFDLSLEMDLAKHGNRQLLNSLFLIAIIILILAVANFLNLASCTFMKKVKDLGIRKAMGANTGFEVLKQMTETYFTVMLAIVLALFMAYLLSISLLQPYGIPFHLEPSMILMGPAIALALSMPFTMYAAFAISATKANSALVKKVRHLKASLLQEVVLTFQFTVVMVMMSLSLLITRQFEYLQQRELGLNPEQVLYFFSNNKHSYRNAKQILTEVKGLSGVKDAAMVTGGLPHGIPAYSTFQIQGASHNHQLMTVFSSTTFPSLMGMKILEGDLFNSTSSANHQPKALLNETAARQMGWPEARLIGRSVSALEQMDEGANQPFEIIGILEDFHVESMVESIAPTIILSSDQEETFVVKLASENSTELIDAIASVWDKYVPKYPFTHHFLDQRFQHLHDEATQQRKFLYVFLGLTLALALFGTLGLSAYLLQIRKKEIALRNVLGAPFNNLVFLFSSRFIKLLLIAAIISLPISIFLSRFWLGLFSYRTDLTADLFLMSIAWVSISIIGILSLQIRRSVHLNPAKELSYE